MSTLLNSIVMQPPTTASSSVIWLHGLGSSGHDFSSIVPNLNLPENHGIRFIFPQAPERPVTINQGMIMPAWYDIKPDFTQEDSIGIKQSQNAINDLILQEEQQGIPSNKIILAGFSQGGALALYTGLCYSKRLQGIIALSTYLPLAATLSTFNTAVNKNLNIFYAHGQQDVTIPIPFALMSKEKLESLGCSIEWHLYHMGHEVSPEELNHISEWLMTH